MPIVRCKKDRHFTQIANLIFKDPRLSYKAKGLMATMLTFHDDWVIVVNHLVSLSTDGTDAVRSGLKELVQYGYLQMIPKRDSKGRMAGTEYILSEIPEKLPPTLAKLLPCDFKAECVSGEEIPNDGIPHTETPQAEWPGEGNQHHTNNGYINNTISSNIRPSINDFRHEVMEQIDYDALLEDFDRGWLDNIVGIVAGVLHSTKPLTRIGGEDYVTEDVQSQLGRLRADHIRYVCDRIDATASNVHNVRAYLLTALYNAVDTMTAHYRTKARYELSSGEYINRCLDLLAAAGEEEIE